MSISTAQALTNQFYEWERCGRGWHKADCLVQLEPYFYPFFGHFLEEGDIIDDGRQPGFLDTITKLFGAPVEPSSPQQEELPYVYPYTDEAPLSLYSIILPRNFRQNAERMEQMLTMLSYRKSPISFELVANTTSVTIQWVCREPDAAFLYSQMQAFFPECALLEADTDYLVEALATELPLYTVDYGLRDEFMRPISSHSLDHDPYTALFGILSRLHADEYVILQILFSGTHNAWAESIITAVTDDNGKGSFFLDAPEMPQLAKEKVSRSLFGVSIRVVTMAETIPTASTLLEHVNTTLVHASTSPYNGLTPLSDPHYTAYERLSDIILRVSHRVGMLLNCKELATFVHFPSVQSKLLSPNTFNTKAAPQSLIVHSYLVGLNEHQGVSTEVGIATEQRMRHMHIIGATGTGKSTLLHSLIMQDILVANGICVLDPHGDLIDTILTHIPASRIGDVVLIDPSDTEHPVGFNILSAHSDLEKELLASDLVTLFKRFSTSWGDQMNSVFANAIMAMVYNTQQFHIGDLRKFLIEQSFRAQVLVTVTDQEIVYYWQKEFPLLKSTSIAPILSRLDTFLRPRVIRSMVCQTHSLNMQSLMDSSKIILVKLSQGLLGMENSFLLGALMVSKIQQIAMSRQAQAVQTRRPFFVYIDEFHNFITPSMATILSGARKYALGLILVHQDMQQVSKLDNDIAASLLANAGTRVCFRLGDNDAKRLQEGFASFSADDLQNLPTGHAIIRVNTTEINCNIRVLPYIVSETVNYREQIINASRAQYSVQIHQAAQSDLAIAPPTSILPIIEAIETIPIAKKESVREHRYLQTFIKNTAEGFGYKATLEVPTPDGSGQVDVLLEKDGTQIAVEISVTTSAGWELHNIQKCLVAGYEQIVLCANNKTKLQQIEHIAAKQLSKKELANIQFVSTDQFHSILSPLQAEQPTETVIKGYRVKVQYNKEGTDKQALLKSIIATSQHITNTNK
ncbi:MAG TPA: type IV secretion system DNA-binding domain-containing protein [Mucilaginibacter sp.]|nr:type IV secretion system DNA-binding domain-containing protein [Mucilaginibacter sp.]